MNSKNRDIDPRIPEEIFALATINTIEKTMHRLTIHNKKSCLKIAIKYVFFCKKIVVEKNMHLPLAHRYYVNMLLLVFRFLQNKTNDFLRSLTD